MFPILISTETKKLHAQILVFDKISFQIHFIYMAILTTIPFCNAHTNLSNDKELQNTVLWYFPKTILKIIFLQNTLKIQVLRYLGIIFGFEPSHFHVFIFPIWKQLQDLQLWCLVRYPLWFTSSPHSLQAYFTSNLHVYLDRNLLS